jgi:Zn-finger nucleic acid-binding protein
MTCPSCSESTLVISYRQGVEIDFCPQCRGVWLDRGELDKLIERSAAMEAAAAGRTAAALQPRRAGASEGPDLSPKTGRRNTWLSNIFD